MTEAQYKSQVLANLGDRGGNALYEWVFPEASVGGTWTFALSGVASESIDRLASPATVQTAIETVGTVGAGNIRVSLGSCGYTGEFVGGLAAQPIPMPVIDGSALDPAAPDVAVLEKMKGSYPFLADKIDQMWDRRSGVADFEQRLILVTYDGAIEFRGYAWTQVEVATGDEKRKWDQQFNHLQAIIAELAAQLPGITTGSSAGNVAVPAAVRNLVHTTPNGLPYGQFARSGYGRFT